MAASDPSSPGYAATLGASSQAGAPVPPKFGRFLLIEELGHGGMGVVYRALDPLLGREVALKVIRGSAAGSAERRARLLREASAMARLRHPGIVEVFEVDQQDEHPFFTMRLIEGPTLSASIAARRFAAEEAVRIGAALARILAYAHSQGLIHRDVKPGNVILEGGASPVLLDFGLVQEPDGDDTRYTRDSQLLGTPMYMAPELALEGPRAAGPSSDQYAVGLILFEMLTGRHPFQAPTQLATLQRALSESPPSMLLYGVPSTLDRVVRRALARVPGERYPNLTALAEAIERHAEQPEGELDAAPPSVAPGAPEPASQPSARQTPGWSQEAEPRLSGASSMPSPRRADGLWLVPGVLLALILAVAGVLRSDAWARRERAQAAELRRQALIALVEPLIAEAHWDEAESAFSAFTRYELNQETPALAKAWQWWGERLGGAGRDDEAIEALAVAYAHSEPGSLSDTLPALARALWRAAEWDRLDATFDVLHARAPALLRDPEMRSIEADLRVVHADFDAALAGGLRPEQEPLVRALRQATRTEHSAVFAQPIDGVDGAHLLAFWGYGQRALGLVRADRPTLPTLGSRTLITPGYKPPIVVRGAPAPQPLLHVDGDGACSLRGVGEALAPLAQFPCTVVRAAVAEPEGGAILVADNRYLGRISPQPDGTFVYAGAERSTNNSNSEVWDLEFADTDRDGEQELWVATSIWGAYDVRVLRRSGEAYALAHRLQLGTVLGLAPLWWRGQPTVAVIQTHDPKHRIDIRAFGPDPPHGEAPGVYLLRQGPAGLERLAFLPLPPQGRKRRDRDAAQCGPEEPELFAGDLDGDGQEELILSVGDTWTYVYAQQRDGSFSRLALDGVVALALIDADADPAKELVVRTADPDARIYVLGAGTDALPIRGEAPIPFADPPASTDAALRQRWRLAGDLVAMGFPKAAAERFERLGAGARGTGMEAEALLQAARLLESIDERERAAELYARVADDPSAESAALEHAFDAFYAARRFPQALKVAERRLALPGPPKRLLERVERLRTTLGASAHHVEFGQGELPDIIIEDAVGLTPDVSLAGLRQRGAGDAPIWRMPLRSSGGPVRLEVSATPRRIDWGTGMAMFVGADTRGSDLTAFGWFGGGGGGFVHHRLKCPGQAGGWGFEKEETEGREITLVWEYDPVDAMASCAVIREGVELKRAVYAVPSFPLPEELTLSFVVRSSVLSISELTLHRVSLWGLRPLSARPGPPELARRLQILGRDEDALLAWEQAGPLAPADALARALLLDANGKRSARDAELRRLLAVDPDAVGILGRALVLYPERVFPALKEIIGDRAYILLFNAMDIAVTVHEDRVEVQNSFTGALAEIEALSPRALAGAGDKVTLIRLLARGGGAWRRMGRSPSARRLLERAWALEDEVRAGISGGPPELLDTLRRELAFAARELALVQLGNGDPDAAMAWLLRGVGISPAPELFADQCASRRDLSLLHDHPRWSELHAARLVGAGARGRAGSGSP